MIPEMFTEIHAAIGKAAQNRRILCCFCELFGFCGFVDRPAGIVFDAVYGLVGADTDIVGPVCKQAG